MIKLQWLRINQFRRVKPGTHLIFGPRYNVLLGRNGTGKTTLLELISAVFRWDFSRIAGDEFDLEYEFLASGMTVRVAARAQHRVLPADEESGPFFTTAPGRHVALVRGGKLTRPAFSAEVKIEPGGGAPGLDFTVDGLKETVRVEDHAAGRTPFEARSPEDNLLQRHLVTAFLGWVEKNRPGREEVLRLFELFLPSADAERFDESLEYYARIHEADISMSRSPEGFVVVGGSPLAGTFHGRLSGSSHEHWFKGRYALGAQQVPFLEKLVKLLDFASAEVVIEFEQGLKDEDMQCLGSGTQAFLFTHRGGWSISDEHMSYGQKRMLAFLYYLDCVEHVAIADELVNGLHHGWIQACIRELGQRQVFLTSQNPLLLDYLTPEPAQGAHSRIVICRWEREAEQMVWGNMAREAVEDFFASCQTGSAQVGELLQSKGLW